MSKKRDAVMAKAYEGLDAVLGRPEVSLRQILSDLQELQEHIDVQIDSVQCGIDDEEGNYE